jgi:hypothetical protein
MGESRIVYRVWWGNLREKDHLEDQGLEGRILLRWIFGKWDVRGMDCIDVAQDRNRWRALVNSVMSKMWGISSLAENRLTSEEGLCSME